MPEFYKDQNNYNIFDEAHIPSQDSRKYQVIPFENTRYIPEDYFTLSSEDLVKLASPEPEIDSDNSLALENMIATMTRNTGVYRLSPFSYNPNDIPNLYSILAVMRRFTSTISLSSSRIDAIARDKYIGELIKYFGSTNLTIAVEGISQRIRNFLDKSLNSTELLAGIANVIASGFQSIKMYMIYTGMETQEDVDEFEKFLLSIRDICRMNNRPVLGVRISFTPLLSTLGTPIQYCASQIGFQSRNISSILYKIRQVCVRNEFPMRLSASVAGAEFSQIIEFADRRFFPLFSYLALNGGTHSTRFSVCFYKNPREITYSEYRKTSMKSRTCKGGKYYATEYVDLIPSARFYKVFNERTPFEETSLEELYKFAKSAEESDLVISDPSEFYLTKNFAIGRREKLRGCHVSVIEGAPAEALIYDEKDVSKSVFFVNHHNILQTSVDFVKKNLPIFTNGFTYNDICAPKDALYIFPTEFARFHNTRHSASNLRRYMHNLAKLYNIHCLGKGRGCQQCSKCTTPSDIKHIQTYTKEEGSEHFYKITDTSRRLEVCQRIILEMEIDDGPSSALTAKYLSRLGYSCFLQACSEKWGHLGSLPSIASSKGIIGELPIVHSRYNYSVRNEKFRHFLSGRFLLEIPVNSLSRYSLSDFDEEFISLLNKHSISHVKFCSVRINNVKTLLKDTYDYVFFKFVFDNRMVNNIDRDVLLEKIEQFRNPENRFIFKQTIVTGNRKAGQQKSSYLSEEIPKDIAPLLNVSIGENKYQTNLFALIKNYSLHPTLFLASFLGTPSNNRAYASIYGVTSHVIGFYRESVSVDSLGTNLSIEEQNGVCPLCGKPKIINAVTGLPFGNAEYEKIPGHPFVCQECFARLS